MSTPVFRRIVRRETHSPRTVAMIVAIAVLIAVLVLAGIEVTLAALAQPELLVSPGAAVAWVVALPEQNVGLGITGGAVLAIVGVAFLALGLAPGRLPKHQMQLDGRAVVVDNGVIAASVAQRISAETGIAREDVTVGVSHRFVDVTVRSRFGDEQDAAPIEHVVKRELAAYALTPSVKHRVRIVTPKDQEMIS